MSSGTFPDGVRARDADHLGEERRLEVAARHHGAGNFEAARRSCEEVVACNAGCAAALHLLGLVAYDDGRRGDAVALIRRAIQRQPGIAHYHCNLGVVLQGVGRAGGRNRLGCFALKPAPVQVHWAGYACTTGLAAIDYALWDAVHVPDGDERWFTETVVRLPVRWCYSPPEYVPAVAPPVIAGGHLTFAASTTCRRFRPRSPMPGPQSSTTSPARVCS